MAEAAVEERAAVPTRFYCHMCNVEINIPNTDFTCPHCAGGFVEELPSQSTSASSSASSLSEGRGSNRFSDLDTLRGEIATLLMSRTVPNVEISIDPGNRRGNLLTLGGGSSGGGGATVGGTGGGRVRPQNLDRLDNVLIDFLHSISGGDVDAPFGNSQMFFMGNPGDYAWGREGIDTIVTQLLNQMETSGPPPLPKDKIAEIPMVEVSAEEVDRKLQCSVCWEDFRMQEMVRKLPCSHIYHENCIVPWLDLHGTCPICRKSLTGEDGAATEQRDDEFAAHIRPVQRLPRIGSNRTATAAYPEQQNQLGGPRRAVGDNGGGGRGSSTSTTAAATAASTSQQQQQQPQPQQQQQRNNIFAFDDGNVDLDFLD